MAAIALALVGTATIVAIRRPQPVQLVPNSVARIDAASGKIVADVPVAPPLGSQLAAVPPSAVWVSGIQQVISVIDEHTNTKTQSIGGFG